MREFLASPLRHRGKAYKFFPSQIQDSILKKEIVRIGSMTDFRALESKKLKDLSEGNRREEVGSEETFEYGAANPNSLLRRAIAVETSDGWGPVFRDVVFSASFDFPTFCFTYEFDEKTYRSLCDEQNAYDACVEITDLPGFCDLLAKRVAQVTRNPQLRHLMLPVAYGSTATHPSEQPDTAIQRAFKKDSIFADNKEGRIVFFESGRAAEGYLAVETKKNGLMDVPGISRFYRLVDIPRSWRPRSDG